MKIAIKHENYEFLVKYLKLVTCLTGLAPPIGTQKLWAITHENGHKYKNDEFLVITLKHVSGHKVIVNRPGTQKLWAIAHENVHKTRKRRASGHISETCKVSYEACKSSRNAKTMGNPHENDNK